MMLGRRSCPFGGPVTFQGRLLLNFGGVRSKNHQLIITSWWLNQPIWKILVKLDHFPRLMFGVKIPKKNCESCHHPDQLVGYRVVTRMDINHQLIINCTLLKTNSSPLKIGFPKRKLVFQPSIFRCKNVSFINCKGHPSIPPLVSPTSATCYQVHQARPQWLGHPLTRWFFLYIYIHHLFISS